MEKVIAEINGLMQAFQSNKPIVSSKAYGWKSAALRMRKDSLKLEKLFQKRVEANSDRLFEEFEQREKLRTQCLCRINEPEWGEPRRFGFQSGTCRAGKKLERHRNDILVEGNFLESTCPAWQPKEDGDNG